MSERDVTEAHIRKEHLAEVDQRRQWAYLATVLLGGTALMLALVALLGATG